jgi:hypothetical protein
LVVGAYIAYNFYNSKHDGDGITIGFYWPCIPMFGKIWDGKDL